MKDHGCRWLKYDLSYKYYLLLKMQLTCAQLNKWQTTPPSTKAEASKLPFTGAALKIYSSHYKNLQSQIYQSKFRVKALLEFRG